ncbi:hypothetical protein PC110_g9468 [Phytophthora cactorum]|uniref:Uncharacterized protein n=1 Tax=Phytophthora cactorum TaxID=29920 RepID=A0A329SDX2_9STRA|nr:hypothetical protein PC123_g3842 [Phytophthora cactorum]RAW34196.1 hypothetical protein PC110_g9468 [Phytophthora cactorum]
MKMHLIPTPTPEKIFLKELKERLKWMALQLMQQEFRDEFGRKQEN